ncbi:hypothetical protein GE115_10040 [Agromyces sp. CFH 90414]|uniref:Uncharacterized protein n=1 Tax=Agromyces agglutinans TaxID=2662258 RepID=A0A6I2F7G2_9MICO|nr:hypothetical protein [Agromyces agglutinans]MRG60204.1 hypothetical protein [Agromyces agglutinans]
MTSPQQPPAPVTPASAPPPGYAPPAYAQPGPPAAGGIPQPARRSPLAIVSLCAGIVTSAIGMLMVLAYPAILTGDGYASFWIVQLAQTVVTVVFALIATVCGIIALVRREPARALAGAGTALGAAALASVVVSLLQYAVYDLL